MIPRRVSGDVRGPKGEERSAGKCMRFRITQEAEVVASKPHLDLKAEQAFVVRTYDHNKICNICKKKDYMSINSCRNAKRTHLNGG